MCCFIWDKYIGGVRMNDYRGYVWWSDSYVEIWMKWRRELCVYLWCKSNLGGKVRVKVVLYWRISKKVSFVEVEGSKYDVVFIVNYIILYNLVKVGINVFLEC